MKLLPPPTRRRHRPAAPPNTGAAVGPKPCSKRVILSSLTGRRAIVILIWLVVLGVPQPAAAGSRHGIRADGKLDFISSEGRVLASIDIEIADTPQARATGLMGRRGLNDSMGMLFVHEQVAPRRFWMRNTPTSLDIVFVSENDRVINIAANTAPLSDTVYSSNGPALYVVEVRAGFCARHGIGEGTLIRWQRKVNPSP